MNRLPRLIFFICLAFFVFVSNTKSQSPTYLFLNEIMPHPSLTPDWVELYNNDTQVLDISGYRLEDTTTTSAMKVFPTGTLVNPNGFLVASLSNRLNNNGDSVYLRDGSGNLLDSFSYSSDPGINVSFGRYPDGIGEWIIFTNPSPNGPNLLPITVTPSPTSSPTPTLTSTPIPTAVLTITPTQIPTLTSTPTLGPTATPILTITPIPTLMPTSTVIPTPTPHYFPKPFLSWWKNFWQNLWKSFPHFPL